MKVIFQYHPFESINAPCPLLPDGRLLLAPQISNCSEDVKLRDMRLDERHSYWDLYSSLSDHATPENEHWHSLKKGVYAQQAGEDLSCDISIDLDFSMLPRSESWRPHCRLPYQQPPYAVGDLFLFFSSFQETRLTHGGFSFDEEKPVKKIALAGYLQVGSLVRSYHLDPALPEWLKYHHSNGIWDPDFGAEFGGEGLDYYVSAPSLQGSGLPGAGTFWFNSDLLLLNLKSSFEELRGVSLRDSSSIDPSPKLLGHLVKLIERGTKEIRSSDTIRV